MTRRSKFGEEVEPYLEKSGTSQSQLAHSIGTARGAAVSTAYVNHTLTGVKKPNAEWADLVADVLNLDNAERQRLHTAAAIDNGFKLDLTKKGG